MQHTVNFLTKLLLVWIFFPRPVTIPRLKTLVYLPIYPYQGVKRCVKDLWNAYLQIYIDKVLWPFQIIIFKSKQFCFTRLGFGLDVAPLIMESIIDALTSQDYVIKSAKSAYVDNIFINESLVSAVHVWQNFSDYGLVYKIPEWLRNGTKVLSLQV